MAALTWSPALLLCSLRTNNVPQPAPVSPTVSPWQRPTYLIPFRHVLGTRHG